MAAVLAGSGMSELRAHVAGQPELQARLEALEKHVRLDIPFVCLLRTGPLLDALTCTVLCMRTGLLLHALALRCTVYAVRMPSCTK